MLRGPIIFLISGTPGAGKTTVSTALMRRFEFGLHIPVDDLREWVVAGTANPVGPWTTETMRQFSLARKAAIQTAGLYAQARFAVAIDDVLFPAQADAMLRGAFDGSPVHRVLLMPGVEVALERNARRTNKSFDTSTLAELSRDLHALMSAESYKRSGWLIVDSSHLGVEETVDAVLRGVGL